MKAQVASYQEESLAPGFWDDNQKAQRVLQAKKGLETKLAKYGDLQDKMGDLDTIFELMAMASPEELEALLAEADKAADQLSGKLDDLTIETLLSGKYDQHSAVLSVHAGAGGIDAQDWAGMMVRMYSRWAEDRGYKVSMVDLQEGQGNVVKSATMIIEGEGAYGYLSTEKGVHRLVRISPYNAAGKRQTSFAAVDVMPEVGDDVDVEIDPADLRVDTYRSSGAGGQHVNKTESAVRITHIPTNVVVTCQNERSQHQNRDMAMRILKARLVELAMDQHKENLKQLAGDYSQITWGSQIRSYVMQPYTMVKDHRTNTEVGNVERVLDGYLEPFISARLKQLQEEKH